MPTLINLDHSGDLQAKETLYNIVKTIEDIVKEIIRSFNSKKHQAFLQILYFKHQLVAGITLAILYSYCALSKMIVKI